MLSNSNATSDTMATSFCFSILIVEKNIKEMQRLAILMSLFPQYGISILVRLVVEEIARLTAVVCVNFRL